MYIWCTVHYLCVHVRCPKAVENFCVHSRNGYYNGHIFHRVIKQFMIQTGDPTGTCIRMCVHFVCSIQYYAFCQSISRHCSDTHNLDMFCPQVPVQEGSQYGVWSLKMSFTPVSNTTDPTLSVWPMLDPTLMAPSSLSL